MPHEDPRLSSPLVKEAIRGWYRSLADHDLEDTAGHLQGLGVLVILFAKMAPATKPALVDDDYHRKLESWKKAIAELLTIDLTNGGAQ